MKSGKYQFFIFVNVIILFNSFNNHYLAQAKQNSIIKLFCLLSVKEDLIKAEMENIDKIANKTCDCYLEEFIRTASHQDAKTKCKLETQESFKL